ncbi:MAG: hypothetical protein WA766_03100 [Candidatus Acidiferrales bacterium]
MLYYIEAVKPEGNGNWKEWHLGEPAPDFSGAPVWSFEADGDELEILTRTIILGARMSRAWVMKSSSTPVLQDTGEGTREVNPLSVYDNGDKTRSDQ